MPKQVYTKVAMMNTYCFQRLHLEIDTVLNGMVMTVSK